MAYWTAPSQAKALSVSAGYRYTYVTVPATASRATFLLLHGFPSTSYDWRHQIAGLRAAGYGVVAPDLLGFGGTDKPLDVGCYRQSSIAAHVRDILDHEKIEKVIAVGHDWGVSAMSWFAHNYPERCHGIVPMAVPFRESGCFPNLDELNDLSEKTLGYAAFGYWHFFTSPDSGSVWNGNARSAFSLLYPQDAMLWSTDFCPVGAARRWLERGATLPPPSYCPQEEMEVWLSIWESNGGFQEALNWYRAAVFGHNDKDEAQVAEDEKKTSLPTLFLAAEKDCVIPAKAVMDKAKASSENLRVEIFDTGHWLQLEQAGEVNRLLMGFAAEVAPP